MKAKYDGNCTKCRAGISVGEEITWSRAEGARHAQCPERGQYELSGGSGYGCDGWTVGETLRASDKRRAKDPTCPEYLTIVTAGREYVREDGLSFGVGDDNGYLYYATARAATDAEAAPVRARIEAKRRKTLAKQALDVLARQIEQRGERPPGSNLPEGERWFDTQTIYGGGSWWVVGPEHVWYVRNNGADGDDWSLNNVRTGGAGGIGWRVARTDELVARLAAVRDVLGESLGDEARERECLAMVDDVLSGRVQEG